MEKFLYRIVVSRIVPDAKEKFVKFLIREFGYSTDRARSFVRFLPGILFESPNESDIKKLVKKLRAIEANPVIQKLVKDKHAPVFIEKSQQRAISKVLSMTLRAGTDTALVYLVVAPEEEQNCLTPLLGREEEIEKHFRLSDFVYCIDDKSLLFFGFTTDLDGLGNVVPKLVRVVRDLVGGTARLHIGKAVFPGDGYSFTEILRTVHETLHDCRHGEKPLKAPHGVQKAVKSTMDPVSEPIQQAGEQEVVDFVFKNARGALFFNLLKLNPETIWFGVKRMKEMDQKRFISRIPWDSKLIQFLAEKKKKQADVKDSETASREIQALVSQFSFHEKMAERKRNQAAVLAKLNQIESLPAFPAVAMQVYNLAMDPDARIEEVQQLLATAPVLTLKILKLVNSSFYGLPQKVDTVKEGIVILGMDEISQMAFGLSLAKTFSQVNMGGVLDAATLRRHATETAMVGKYLCQARKDLKVTSLFTAGILHDIGKLFLADQFPALYESVINTARKLDLPVCMLEEEVFGYNHGIVGGVIAKKWNLPKTLVQAISFHHHPSFASEHEDLAAIVGFADSLCLEKPEAPEGGRRDAWMSKGLLDVLQVVFEAFTMESVADKRREIHNYLAENQAVINILNNE